jgi:ribosomal protein S18 acetylase RimI-like enzyme
MAAAGHELHRDLGSGRVTTGRKRLSARLLDAAEEWIYRLNERDHWIFRIYDRGNELYASLLMRGIRRRASTLDAGVTMADGAAARIRFLAPADEEAFAELLANLKARYRPPHPVDRDGAARALRRRSYLPFGLFIGDRLVGYLLLRLFFPWRAVTGIWTLPETHNLGLAQACLRQTAAFSRSEGLADYATVPIDNLNSVRVANGAGWRTQRTNRRFHVLKLE